jgi:gamma-glutamyltranspeptidase/glutathione hydrolase
VQSKGGYLTVEDLARHTSTWNAPIRTAYRGVEVLEHPPNGNGITALLALNLVQGYDLGEMDYWDPARWHLLIESMRLALADAARYIADPAVAAVPVAELLSAEYAARRRGLIQPDRALSTATAGQPERLWSVQQRHRDTVYLAVVDGQGNAVSFINSLYHGFGSGMVVPGTGVCLQNRGAGFTLEPGHPNTLAGGKRPYHTIIPSLALRDGRLWLCFGVVGGFMQPQGHLQVLVNLIDHGLNPQSALDAPRFRVDELGGPRVMIETDVPLRTRKALAAMGHTVQPEAASGVTFGGGQVIAVDPESGVLWGGSDPRKDGCAFGF